MEKNKLIGLVLVVAGLFILTFPLGLNKILGIDKVSFIDSIQPQYIIVAGFALAVVGAMLLKKGSHSKQKQREVPIYKGKEIVGYRQAD